MLAVLAVIHPHRRGLAGWRQHVLPSVVSHVCRIVDCVPNTVGPNRYASLRVVDRRSRGNGGRIGAWIRLLPIALHRSRSRSCQRVADRRRGPGHLVCRQRVGAVVHRRRRNHNAGLYRLVASRSRGRAGEDLVRIAIPGISPCRHVRSIATAFGRCCGTLTWYGNDPSFPSASDFLRVVFAEGPAFSQLCFFSEGVPRDALQIAAPAASLAQDAPISDADVTRSNRDYFRRDKERRLSGEQSAQRNHLAMRRQRPANHRPATTRPK